MDSLLESKLQDRLNVLYVAASSKKIDEALASIGLVGDDEIPTFSMTYTSKGGTVEVLPQANRVKVKNVDGKKKKFYPSGKIWVTSKKKYEGDLGLEVAEAFIEYGIPAAVEVMGQFKGKYMLENPLYK